MLCRGGRHGSVRTSKTPAAKKFPCLHHKEYRQGNFSIYRLCSVLIAAQGIALTAQDTQRLHGGFAHAHFHHGSFVGGAKGIALLDESSGFPRLHYVFNVSDTGVRRNSRDPDLWQYKEYSYLSICCRKSPEFGQN